jgi:hypothetical protein
MGTAPATSSPPMTVNAKSRPEGRLFTDVFYDILTAAR